MAPSLKPIEQQSTALMRDDCSQESFLRQNNKNGVIIKDLQDQTYEERWSESEVQGIVTRWKLSSLEERQLRDLGNRLRDVGDHFKVNPMELVRYLRGPKKFEQIEGIFRDMLEWRKAMRADYALEEYSPSKALLYYIPSAILKGLDRDGDPIYLERGGVMDGPGLLQFGMDDVMQHIVWLREQATRGEWIRDYERTQGKPPAQVTIIFDLHGISSRHMKSGVIPMFKEIVKINQEKYNGMAKRIILLRAPSIFQMFWNIAKHFFPPEGRKLMVFTGPHDYLTVLDKYVDREVLPPCICKEGKGSAVDCMPQNFNGGLIPSNPEKSIPDEPWITRMLSPPGHSKPRRMKETENEKLAASPAPLDESIQPICLAVYKNVRILAGLSSPQWHDEFEAVLVQ